MVTLENKPNEVRRSHEIRDNGPYSARNSSKGALIDEAGRVFSALANGQSIKEIRQQVLRGALRSQRSSENRKRIWTSIQQRYIVDEVDWLTLLLANECAAGPHSHTFLSLLQLREEAGVPRTEAVAEFVRETAYTWANRLLALRCMEARELIDEVILQKEVYGGRSLEHHRLAQREPEHCTGEDDGRFVMLQRVFARQAERLPMLFDPQSPGVALRPSPAVLKRCIALLSGTQTVRSHDPATGEVFTASDSLGWAYQYWNTEEKDRVFEKVRTQKGAKIEGADIIPATQLYTESYMVQFLVQNSLGATWMGMHPDSKLYEQWDYYVRDADRVERNSFRSSDAGSLQNATSNHEDKRNEFRSTKKVRELTFLDPACGSGHFLLEAFDLFFDMYVEERKAEG